MQIDKTFLLLLHFWAWLDPKHDGKNIQRNPLKKQTEVQTITQYVSSVLCIKTSLHMKNYLFVFLKTHPPIDRPPVALLVVVAVQAAGKLHAGTVPQDGVP